MIYPLISIIMPVYNAKDYIGKTISSILTQDFDAFELIIINDGSTDGSDIICKKIAAEDSRITIINQKNTGTSAARNAGLDIARGKYITFCDHDDEFLPHLLVDNFNLATSNRADFVAYSFKETLGSEKETNEKKSPFLKYTADDIYKCYVNIRSNPLFKNVWNHLYNRECIGNVRFYEQFTHGLEDILFNMEILNGVKKNIIFSNLIYYNQNVHAKSSSHSFCKSLTDSSFSEYEYFLSKELEFLNIYASSKNDNSFILIDNIYRLYKRCDPNGPLFRKLSHHNFFSYPFKKNSGKILLFAMRHSPLLFSFLCKIQYAISEDCFENTAMFGFWANIYNSKKGRWLFNLCNNAIKCGTIPFRLLGNK